MQPRETKKDLSTSLKLINKVEDGKNACSGLEILEAKHVYILMSDNHRISRNRRAEWLFSRFETVITLPSTCPDESNVEGNADFLVVSVIPTTPPPEWSAWTRDLYRYRITTDTLVTFLARRYWIVYCIDVSPSVAAVDVQAGTVVFDRIFQALKSSLDGLMRPFKIPGSLTIFQPKIFITVITHSPFVASIEDEVILQGKLLEASNFVEIIKILFDRLNLMENKLADTTSSLLVKLDDSNDNYLSLFDGDEDVSTPSKSSVSVSADFSLVDMLKQALIALSLLPENSSAGLVILSDGVLSVPDGRYLDNILSQLRYNTVSCSFIQLSSPFHPHLCHGTLAYADLMKFIASATFGAFLTEAPDMASNHVEMNIYHHAFLAWNFQSYDSSPSDSSHQPAAVKPGEWSIRNKCFFTVRDMPIVKKLQYESVLAVDYMKILSCRLREGFLIKDITRTPDGNNHIKLTLPWKFLIYLEYVLIANKSQPKVNCILSLEGPYDFLHDVTCLAGRTFPSYYRQLMVNRFWATRKNLSESDRLLVHLNSFSSNPAFYSIPDSLRNGVPLFYFATSSAVPILQASDFPYPQFAQFWKPVCVLDTTVWQKWMHTHRIGVILEHDHPLPKHLHYSNSTGRFHVILCRQAIMALNTLLKDMSSFVLVENHSYVTLMYNNEEKAPFSFYIIRVTSKPPYVVLRLAFLVGTPGHRRHETVSLLRNKIADLTFPQRLKDPPRWRFPSNSQNKSEVTSKATWSNMRCCILMQKPIEKILIRYEKVPQNFSKVLMSQDAYESVINRNTTTSKQSTFGFRPTHPNPSSTTVMVPELFNTVARYLHHRRWIWWFPKTYLPHIHLVDAAELLSTITKIRLQEGFRFAYSCGGTVSMVMEVQMKNSESEPQDVTKSTELLSETQGSYYTPCVLQFVLFPPAVSLTSNYEGDLDAFEDTKDLFFVTECWIEPQCGTVSNCPLAILNDLEYCEILQKIFEINQECFLSLGTFEYVKGLCVSGVCPDAKIIQSRKAKMLKSVTTQQNCITMIPFEHDLGRILPKSQKSKVLFSMLFQDLCSKVSADTANEILHSTWCEKLNSIHDTELQIESKQSEELLRMIIPEHKSIEANINPPIFPSWRCFVKSVEPTQLLITLIPKTLRDAKQLFFMLEINDYLRSEENDDEESSSSTLNYHRWVAAESETLFESETLTRLSSSLGIDVACISGGRKRIRALSGGECAPALKKAFWTEETVRDIVEEGPSALPENIKQKLAPSHPSAEQNVPDSENPTLSSGNEGDSVKIETELNIYGSLTLPIFVFDCSISTIRERLIFKDSPSHEDACMDFRIFKTKLKREPSSTSDIPCPDEHFYENIDVFNCNSENESELHPLGDYFREINYTYRTSYVESIFKSLQFGYAISREDLQAVVSICDKDVISIDITEFLMCVCGNLALEKGSCQDTDQIHSFIQKKFQDIIRKEFTSVKSNLFFFKNSSQNSEHVGDKFVLPEAESTRKIEGRPKGSVERRLSANRRRDGAVPEPGPTNVPLFMYLRCSATVEGTQKSLIISDLPVCFESFIDTSIATVLIAAQKSSCELTLQLIFLTSPTNTNDDSKIQKEVDTLAKLPHRQNTAVKNAINEIRWLLDDEMTSFQSRSHIVTPNILADIATHVKKSVGKQGCFRQSIPLKFVCEAQVNGYLSFVKRFSCLHTDGYGLKQIDNWWYLVKKDFHSSSECLNEECQDNHETYTRLVETFEENKAESKASQTPESALPFWIIFSVEETQVHLYSHCRYNEENLVPLQLCQKTRLQIVTKIVALVRIVNQDLLLQSLHDSRICSPLLERDYSQLPIEENNMLPLPEPLQSYKCEIDLEAGEVSNAPGIFSCDVVWETTFNLHPRLGSGPGKSAYSRGMQILRSTLMAFEVSNRENMFVYRNANGNVFYLRFYRIYETVEGMDDLPSQNPSPRSSISSKSRYKDVSERQSKEDLNLGLLKELVGPKERVTDGSVLLKVHGVTDAGSEIQEQLIQSLRNKLDDAVLDVLSVTLDRNPHCKLTPYDVHFIQKPFSIPDTKFKFTTGRYTKILLRPFAFYLHQNLLQFLNLPKYTRYEVEYHFQDYSRAVDGQGSEDQNVYLYNQSPGGTGSRGVACASVALVDKTGSLVVCTSWKRPDDILSSLSLADMASFVETYEFTNETSSSEIMVEVCVWKQGRINMEILKHHFSQAIAHAGWDLAMELHILTTPVLDEKSAKTVNIEGSGASSTLLRRPPRRRNSSNCASDPTLLPEPEDQQRTRSWSYAGRRNYLSGGDGKSVKGRMPSSVRFGEAVGVRSLRHKSNSGMSSQEGYAETIVCDHKELHSNYSVLMKRWFSLGKKLIVPSLRVATVSLQPKHYVDGTVAELDKIIGNVSPDSSRLQFWKIDKRTPEYVSIGENISEEDRHVKRKVFEDMATFDGHKIELLNMEKKDESEYPEKVLKIFRSKEHFQPFKPNAVCVMIVHNVTHWKNCMDSAKSIDSTFHATEVMKSLYKFPPMNSDVSGLFDDRTSLNSERSRNPSKTGQLGLLREYSEDDNSTLIQRQRFLLITVLKSSINFFFYNWSKESSDRLVEHTKILGSWTQCRIQVLSSILLQKSGLYYNQPIFRLESSALALGHIDIKDLILNPSPPKNLQITVDRFQGRKSVTSKPNFQMSDVYRNLRHYGSRMPQEAILKDPVLTYGKKTITMLNSGKKETENALFRNWLSRGPSASNVIGMEAIEAFKHASRTIHYCMTPIIFLPRWRNSVALTRDSSVGVYKRVGAVERSQDVQKLRLGLFKDSESRLKYPIWSVWKRAQFSNSEEDGNSSPTLLKEKREEDAWHNALCNSFLQDFMQYLQTLGFIPTHNNGGSLKRRQPVLTSENWSASYVGRLERIRRMSDGSVLSVESEGNFSSVTSPSKLKRNGKSKVEEDDGVFYLQKSLPGGIILLEVGLSEPFCYCKIHALEANRIQQNKSSGRIAASHSTLTFMDECDKMKVLMHLHSFAYDFHLRCLHSNITGRQLMLKQGYHVTKFLDDFICYYCKGPNFARNTIHLGILTVQNVSTPSHILFNYILTHDKVYQMKVIRMTPLYSTSSSELSHEYILVYSLSKKVVYKELEDENHTEEFDMSLLISHDTPFCPAKPYSMDPSVLRLKYYVILTSRRELYPKVISETNLGKLCPVTAPKPVSGEIDRLSAHFVNLHSGSELSEHEMTVSATSGSENNTDIHVQPKEPSLSQLETGPDGIREENILYMGYFSSHEQMMQQIVKEQTAWADNFIKNVVGNAAVDCRRDLLWQRLLVGDKKKHLKEDLTIRETVGVLTYWEFSELLELVWVQPLQKMDSRLQTLLQQPISFFQTLIKLLTYGRQYQHRYFVSPDGSIHQLAIINPNMYKSIVVAEMNMEQRTCDLNLVFKESIGDVTSLPLDIDVEILSLVETAVGACCYCNWINFL